MWEAADSQELLIHNYYFLHSSKSYECSKACDFFRDGVQCETEDFILECFPLLI